MGKKGLDLMTRKKVSLEMAKRYRQASSKREKSRMLHEFCALTGYNRAYAAFLLRNAGKTVTIRTPQGLRLRLIADPDRKIQRNRKPTYDEAVGEALSIIWTHLDFLCSRSLHAALPWATRKLEQEGILHISDAVREKLLRISVATIDRLLACQHEEMTLKSRSHTRRGSLLKHQVPIRTHRDLTEHQPGFLEIDLVGHDGGNPRGDFAYTSLVGGPGESKAGFWV